MQFQAEPGAALGPYKIIRLLGRGGMGEVHLAQDTRLDRKVALKLLSAEFIRDPERVLRFSQEARAASALNHPNIITIYDIGEVDGLPFIATEFIDGRTLREKIASGPLPLAEALDIAVQVGGALAAAHEAGIVHRDVKPENIMVRADGYVKVLDFGLAKLTERAPEPGDSGTVLMGPAHTTVGTVMGTAQYMSPEQARGRTVDARSDIFSLAIVLYEMIAGKPPFSGETPSHQIVAILEKTPEPLGAVASNIPPELDTAVTKALEKTAGRRYQTAREFVADLKEIRRWLDVQASLDDKRASGRLPAAGRRPASRRAWLAIAAFAAIAAAGWFGFTRLKRNGVPFQNFTSQEVTDSGKLRSAVISPDGRYVVYVQVERGEASLYMRQVVTGGVVQIQPPAKKAYLGLTFSRDGEYLYFTRAEPGTTVSALYRISSLGGEPLLIKDGVYSAVSFSPDNRQIAYVRVDYVQSETQVMVARIDGSDARMIKATRPPEALTSDPAWSPDGKFVAVGVGRPSSTGYHGQPVLIPVKGGSERPLGPPDRWTSVLSVAWAPDNSSLYLIGPTPGTVTATHIWNVPLSNAEPRQITREAGALYSGLSVTADGKSIVSVKREIVAGLFVMSAADPADVREISSQGPNFAGVFGLAWTPEGKIIYAGRSAGSIDLWLREAAEGPAPQRLTNDNAMNLGPRVTADGKRLFFSSNRGTGVFHAWSMDLPAGEIRQVTADKTEELNSISADGKTVVYSGIGPGFWRISSDGGTPTRLTDKPYRGPELSPDGQSLAYVFIDEQAGRRARFAIMPASGGEPSKVFDYAVPSAAGAALRWTPDGTALSYAAAPGGVGQIWIQPVAGGAPRQATDFKSSGIFSFCWSPDGKQLVLSRGTNLSDAILLRQKS